MKKLFRKIGTSVATGVMTLTNGVTALAASAGDVATISAGAESGAAQTRYLITGGIILAIGIVFLTVLHFKTKK